MANILITGGGVSSASNVFTTISSDTGTTTADAVNDTLAIIGTGGLNTSITGDILTIDASGVPSGSALTVDDETNTLSSAVSKLIFIGGGVTAVESSTGEISITIPDNTPSTNFIVSDGNTTVPNVTRINVTKSDSVNDLSNGVVEINTDDANTGLPITVQSDGINVDTALSTLNFTGSGVTTNQTSSGIVEISIAGSSGGGGGSSVNGTSDISTYTATSSSVADGASTAVNLSIFKSGILGSISANSDCTIRGYSSIAARTADASRDTSTPAPSSTQGFLFEVTLTANTSWSFNNGIAHVNLEDPAVGFIYLTVFNESGATATIEINITGKEIGGVSLLILRANSDTPPTGDDNSLWWVVDEGHLAVWEPTANNNLGAWVDG